VIYFGYPRAHEDDAERALHAGLDLIQAIGHLTTGTGAPLQARIGVTTGLVIVGDLIGTGPAQEVVALGDPLNIASRLQSLAAPNGLVVDKTTRALTSGFYSFIDLGEQSLKGLAESVQVWSVTGAVKPQCRFAGTRTARPTPFVNRDHELGTLLSTWGAAAMGTGQLVLIAGDPASANLAWYKSSRAGWQASRMHMFWCKARRIIRVRRFTPLSSRCGMLRC
jgi:hypothetical protein